MQIISQLDLNDHIAQFQSFFSRESELFIEGDQELHFRYIKALDKLDFNSPPKVADFTNIKNHLKKIEKNQAGQRKKRKNKQRSKKV
jgi:DNA mismatch repair protein MutS2